jgi:protein-S-isoprenylcysteine O-methyltransferase Ste14
MLLARFAKKGSRRGAARPPTLVILAAVVLLRALGVKDLVVHDVALRTMGTILFAAGLALAVWARAHLGRNWGMPMTQKDEPELVTTGPYRLIRHPIYTGILLAVLGSSLAMNLYWLVGLVVIGAYFVYSATVEERQLASSFPATYPGYRARTKMLIPFVLCA